MLTAVIAALAIAAAFARSSARRDEEARAVRALLEALDGGVTAPWRRMGAAWARMTTAERLRSDLGRIERALPPSVGTRKERLDRLLMCRRRRLIDLEFFRRRRPYGEVRAYLTSEGRQELLRLRREVELPAPTARLLT
jgi:hypothetical protein